MVLRSHCQLQGRLSLPGGRELYPRAGAWNKPTKAPTGWLMLHGIAFSRLAGLFSALRRSRDHDWPLNPRTYSAPTSNSKLEGEKTSFSLLDWTSFCCDFGFGSSGCRGEVSHR